jgi:hypothetical protein
MSISISKAASEKLDGVLAACERHHYRRLSVKRRYALPDVLDLLDAAVRMAPI